MLDGLKPLELGRLRMSVGYGTHKRGRPLGPIEVGMYLRKARDAGMSLSDCASAINLSGTGHIGRFLRILELPNDLHHLIGWGSPTDAIGFTCAVELAKLKCVDDQRVLANSILSEGLNSKEVRQVGQLRNRSGRTIEACVQEIVGLRPTIEKRFVFIGSIDECKTIRALSKFTQNERDSILECCIKVINLENASGRLGKRLFTLVGDEHFDVSMKRIGKGRIEKLLRTHILEAIENARRGS